MAIPHPRRIPRWLALALAPAALLPATTTAAAPQEPAAETKSQSPLAFARGLVQRRQYSLAAEEFERFLTANPTSAEAGDALFGLANCYLFLGKSREAREQFEALIARYPAHPRVATARFRVGEAAYMLGDLPAAREALRAYVEQGAETTYLDTALPYLGDVYYRTGDLAGARAAYEKALAEFPGAAGADRSKFGLAMTLSALGQYDEALKQLGELTAQADGPFAEKAAFQVGSTLFAAGRPAEAAEAFAAFERDHPRSPRAAEARLAQAEALFKAGRRDEAEPILRPLIDEAPRNLAAQAAYALGVDLLERGQAVEAQKLIEGALTRFDGAPTVPALLFRAGEAAMRLGQVDDARTRFARLAEKYPDDPWADDALLIAANLALKARDLKAARGLAERFAAKYPDHDDLPTARLIEARADLDSGKAAPSIAKLEAIMALPAAPPATAQAARYYLGLAYRADGQPEKAEAVLGALAGAPAAPATAAALFLVGQGHFEAGRFGEAADSLKRFLDENPKDENAPNALALLALAHGELGQGEAASAALERLVADYPGHPIVATTQIRRAESLFDRQKWADAEPLFRAAVATAGLELAARARSGLAWTLLRSGRPAEAAAEFAALLEAAPDDPLAPEAALARARSLEQAERPNDAIAAYATAAERYQGTPQGAASVLGRARLLARTGKAAEAAALFGKIGSEGLRVEGLTPDALLAERGWALLDAGDPAGADAVFNRILNEFPESPHADEARLNLAESAFKARQLDRVADLLRPIVDRPDTDPRLVQPALYRLGRTAIERKDWPAAQSTFARLVEGFPDGDLARESRFWMAEAAFQAGDAAGAEPAFAALEVEAADRPSPEPWVATARLRRLQCLVMLEKWDDVLTVADPMARDLPDGPQRPEVEYARGRALQSTARFDEARAAFQAAIDGRPASDLAARAQLMRGETYFRQEQFRDALREFLKVDILYRAPTWQAAALLEAGKVYERLDQWAEAADIYEKLRSDFPDDPAAAEAAGRLEGARRRVARTGAPRGG